MTSPVMHLLEWLSPWRHHPPPPPPSAASCPDVIREAQERKAAAVSTRPEVDRLTTDLAQHRRKNHFGESLQRTYGGKS